MSERIGDWIQCFQGGLFYPLDPRPEDFDIRDIAHALSNVCRFAGHCRVFYSVAQHSVMVSDNVPQPLKLKALLHDATEAYYGDMPRPFKRAFPDYKVQEQKAWVAICERFGLSPELEPEIKEADNRALFTEKRDLLTTSVHPWGWAVEPYPTSILALDPRMAKILFLRRYTDLTGETVPF